MNIRLGTSASGAVVSADVMRLIDTRLLIQANSGGGKSWMMRGLSECLAGHVQTIILDPEGEFATLREKFDFVLVGQGGEIPCETRSASLVARKLMEVGASAVIDLFDLTLPNRRLYVRLFIESLMHLPKAIWHPLAVFVDEAQDFCPEKGFGEAESKDAIISLMCQGRKRSYCGILGTQRISKLSKDAAAEARNKLIGLTNLDVDLKRAADELGFNKERWRELRELDPGEFFGFGPAFAEKGIIRFQSAAVQTTHPKAGRRHKLVPPSPTDAVKRIVAGLADLPKQAEDEARDVAGLKRQLADARRQLEQASKGALNPKAEQALVDRARSDANKAIKLAEQRFATERGRWAAIVKYLRGRLDRIGELSQVEVDQPANAAPEVPVRVAPQPVTRPAKKLASPATAATGDLPKGERIVLTAVAQYPDGITREQLGVLTGYKRTSRITYLQKLREQGLIDTSGELVIATEAGLQALGSDFEPLPTGAALRDYWIARLPEGERKILTVLIEAHPNVVDHETLDSETGYKRTSRITYLGKLRARQLIETSRDGVKASDTLF